MYIFSLCRELPLFGGEVCARYRNYTTAVEHNHIFLLHAKRYIQLGTRDGRCAGPVDNHLHLRYILAVHLKRVEQAGSRYNRCSVLVVVHNRNIEFGLKPTFNLKALRCLNILKVYTTEGRCYGLYSLYELFGVLLVYLNIEHVYSGIYLKKQPFSLHNRFAGYCTYVSKTKHRCTVGDNGYKVTLVGIFIGILRVTLYLKTRLGNSRRICQREVGLCKIWFCGNYLYFSRALACVVVQSIFFCYFSHSSSNLWFCGSTFLAAIL